MRNLVILIALLFFCTPVAASKNRLPDTVVWGLYCGECAGNCSTMRRIDSSGLKIDKSNNYLLKYFESKPFNYEFNGTEEPKSEYENFKWLLELSVPTIVNKEFEVFGQPDAYDQCGYYISYSIDAKSYRVLIDPDKVPDELAAVTSKLFKR